jgi:phospholipid/cholesterol/gamma-HCH transport system substrate-binding protein
VPIGPVSFDNGTDIDENPPTSPLPGSQTRVGAPGQERPRVTPGTRRPAQESAWADERGFGPGMSSGYAGTAGDRAVLNALLADASGRPADSYGSLGSLLYGPVVRGG